MTSSGDSRRRARVLAAYERRRRDPHRQAWYAPWQGAEVMGRAERTLAAARLLHRVDRFPDETSPCLEVGVGRCGWLPDLALWGVLPGNLVGVDLALAQFGSGPRTHPEFQRVVSLGEQLPFPDHTFQLTLASTLFSSIPDDEGRSRVAGELMRVTRPGGALVIYDVRVDNPRNPDVRALRRRELRRWYPDTPSLSRRLTLAPPLARWADRLSWRWIPLLGALPWLRSHDLHLVLPD